MRKRKAPEFITAKSQKDRALQTCAREFLMLAQGAAISTQEAELFFALCSLALPMRYRFPRSYADAIKETMRQACERALANWEPDDEQKEHPA